MTLHKHITTIHFSMLETSDTYWTVEGDTTRIVKRFESDKHKEDVHCPTGLPPNGLQILYRHSTKGVIPHMNDDGTFSDVTVCF